MNKSFAFVSLFTVLCLTTACPVRNEGTDTGDQPLYDGGPRDTNGNEDPFEVVDCQNSTSAQYPGTNATVTLIDRVVTSQMFSVSSSRDGFFISDPQAGPYAGILVVAPVGEVTVALNDVIDVQGTLIEYQGDPDNSGTETQIEASQVTRRSPTTPVAPVVVDAALLGNPDTAETYEGVLVKIDNVSVQLYPDGSLSEFGMFQVTGLAQVDDELFKYVPGRDEVFTSIVGVVRYSYYGDFAILPRSASDIVSQSGARVDVTPAQVQNPDAAGRPDVCPRTDMSCAPVRMQNMVVVSPVLPNKRESQCLDAEQDFGKCPYYLYAFFIADPNDVDANGRLNPWAGIKVMVTPGTRWVRGTECEGLTGDALLNCGHAGHLSSTFDSNYSFESYFSPSAISQTLEHGFPQVGDIVIVDGEPAEYYDNTQIHRLIELTKVGSTDDANAVVDMPLPALFDGNVEAIYSGLLRVPETETDPEIRPAMAPGVDTEKYEGLLVELANVQTLDTCIDYPYGGDATQMTDFGYFRVAGASAAPLHGVEIGTQYFALWDIWGGWWRSPSSDGPAYADRNCANTENKCDDSRRAGQSFSSIVGVIDYAYGVHRLEPRGTQDVACATDCEPNPNPSFCP